jgi:CheY-like chemotaxis protein
MRSRRSRARRSRLNTSSTTGPAAAAAIAREEMAAAAPNGFEWKKAMRSTVLNVLVVDDGPVFAATVDAHTYGCETCLLLHAKDGAEAEKMVKTYGDSIAFVICDLNMPSTDGVELLGRLAALQVKAPVVIVSGAFRVIRKSAEALARARGIDVSEAYPKPRGADRGGYYQPVFMSPYLIELATLIHACPICRWHHVSVGSTDEFGLLVLRHGHGVGVWSVLAGELLFRNVASWDVVARVPSVDDAHCATIDLLTHHNQPT